jgi:hypothetical protein
VNRNIKGTELISEQKTWASEQKQKRERKIEANKISEGTARESEQKLEGNSSPELAAPPGETKRMANNNYKGTVGKSGQDPDGDVSLLIISVPSAILFAHLFCSVPLGILFTSKCCSLSLSVHHP